MKPAEKRSAPEPDSATHLRSRGAGVHHASTSAVAEKQAWDRASAYFRSHYASAASASAGPGWGHEQATIAAAASGSTGTCAAKEPLLWGRMWAPDVEDVPLPQNFKRVRTEDSEEAGWDPMALQRWHDRRQKMESSAVADKESSAVADTGMTPGMESIACTFLVERQVEEEPPSQATTLHLASPARSQSEKGDEEVKEDEEEVARQIKILNDLGQEWKDSQEGKLGKAKGKGRSGGRAETVKDRLRELQARGEITPGPARRAKEVTANMQ